MTSFQCIYYKKKIQNHALSFGKHVGILAKKSLQILAISLLSPLPSSAAALSGGGGRGNGGERERKELEKATNKEYMGKEVQREKKNTV